MTIRLHRGDLPGLSAYGNSAARVMSASVTLTVMIQTRGESSLRHAFQIVVRAAMMILSSRAAGSHAR